MEYPIIREIPRKLEPVTRDTFIDDLGGLATEQEVELETKEEDEQHL